MAAAPGEPNGKPATDPKSLRGLGRDTAIYGLGTILTRVVSFIMLPVYTRFLTPSDYGLLQILDLTLDIAAIVISAGATAGLSRFYFKATDTGTRNRLLSTAYLTQIGLNLVGALILLAASPLIWHHVLSEAGTVGMVRLASINFVTSMLTPVPMLLLRLERRASSAVTVSITRLILQLGLNILFVVGLEMGPLGMLLSTFVTNISVGLVMGSLLLRRTGLNFDLGWFRQMRKFGIPMQIASAGAFIIQFGDRFFLESSHGLGVVGVYGVAYQFGFLLSGTVASPFFSAWSPIRFQLLDYPPAERDRAYNRALLFGDLMIVSGAVALAVFIRPVIQVMTTPEFHGAATIVPVVLAAAIMHNWVSVVSFGINVAERTRFFAFATWVTVALILVLYAVLIPPFAGLGAAVATLIAMTFRVWLTYRYSQRLFPIAYDLSRHFRLFAAGALAVTLCFSLRPAGFLALTAVGLAAATIFTVLVWQLVLHADERALLGRIARNPAQFWTLVQD
jgi:O-antigen/teichoic acid export membrane protein